MLAICYFFRKQGHSAENEAAAQIMKREEHTAYAITSGQLDFTPANSLRAFLVASSVLFVSHQMRRWEAKACLPNNAHSAGVSWSYAGRLNITQF